MPKQIFKVTINDDLEVDPEELKDIISIDGLYQEVIVEDITNA